MKKALLYVVMMVLLDKHTGTGGILINNGEVDEAIQKYQEVTVKQLERGRWRRSVQTLSTVSKTKKGHLDRVTFAVDKFDSKQQWIVDLSLNQLLLPFGSKTSYQGDDGNEQALPSQPIDNCYYHGTIQGLKDSTVALSTCEGLEGVIFDGKESFYIQPNNKEANSHIMYRIRDLKVTKKAVCDQHDFANYSSIIKKNNKRIRRSLESETKYIELVMVNDLSQFNHFKQDMQKTIQRSRNIANLVDSLYRPLNVRVALIELIIWNKNDPIYVDPASSKALENFNKWRIDELRNKRKLKHDNAQLLTHVDFEGSTVGKAHVLSICTSRSAGVIQDHSTSAASTASTFAHEMGHNLGMGHDDPKKCKCDAKKENQDCIMSAVARAVPATDWSSCSREYFNIMLDRGLDSCLFNKPKKLYGNAVCGNGFQEEGEECDCGSVEECAKYTDNCCNATTCKLKPGVECDQGPCCDQCKFKSSQVICRNSVNECDLPEHCTGKTALCPDNRFVYHGKPCANGKGYCQQGECPTLDGQCQFLWGSDVKSGPELCYTLNMRGNIAGSCDKLPDGKTYAKCKYKDIYCGMLHCTNTKTNLPIIGTERTSYRYKWHIDGKLIECRSTSVEVGLDTDDPGIAREGTKCGDEKACMSNQCMNVTDLLEKNAKCPGDCSGNGMCDSNGNCYCNDCWTGDDCTKSTPCMNVGARAGHSKLAGYIILVFLIIILIVALVASFIYREKLKTKWQQRKRAKRYESTQSTSPTKSTRNSGSQPDNRQTPFATAAPRPMPNAYTSSQPGKIELPSWPSDGNTNQDIHRVPRRPPPGPPNAHRASSPPVSSIRDNPMFNQRPDSYAGVLDRKPQPSFPVGKLDRSYETASDPALPNQSVRPSDVKRTQGKPPKPPIPAHRPGRVPPPPPTRPGIPPRP